MQFRDEDYALALVDGAFTKAIVVQLVRKVEGKQFFEVCIPPILAPDQLRASALSVCATGIPHFLEYGQCVATGVFCREGICSSRSGTSCQDLPGHASGHHGEG